jgi:flagellar capping protein FliD
MGELRFSGLSSGIDTTALVKQLMNIESRRLANFKVSKMTYEKQTSALDELRNKINSLKSAAASLADISKMQIYAANSSNKDILTATAAADAATGSHTVDVGQLATAETWIQDASAFSYKTDYVGGGNFIYTYHNEQRVITTVENQTTLQDFVNLINNDENNPGVTASLLYLDGKYHLMLNGQETGRDYQITIDASSTEIWKPDTNQPYSTLTAGDANAAMNTRISDLDQFSGAVGQSDVITIGGRNHAGSALPDTQLTVTKNTTVGHLIDAINKHYDGTATARLENGQIWLTSNTPGASGLEISLSYSGDAELGLPTMTVAAEGGATAATLAAFDPATFIETQNANNAKVKIDGFPHSATNEVQSLFYAGDAPTAGTFRLTLNGQTTEPIAYNAAAADIQNALSALNGIAPGDITVTGTDMLTGDIAVTFTGNLAGTDIAKMTVSDDAALNGGAVSVVETAKGNDGWIHRNSNNISDALSGITLNINDVTEEGSPVKVTVNRNTATISKTIQTLVTSYNELVDLLKSNTAYNAETKKMGTLSRDVAATSLKSQIKGPFISIARGFVESMDQFVKAGDLGLTLDGAGKLEFDTDTFNAAIGDNYKSVLELLGAAKNGNSSSSAVQFYSASDKYTTAGIYQVKVEVNEDNEIVSAKIRLSGETEYRDAASWDGNIIFFDNSFKKEGGGPAYPEHSLQLRVDLTPGTYGTDANPVTIRVKQGIFGTLEDMLEGLLKKDGQMDISTDAIDEKMTRIDDKIKREELRLEKVEQRLIAKYARLEKMLSTMQQQLGAVTAMMG